MVYRGSGFTIIETTLVLAITGLLATTILISISTAINQQRYTDSVNQALDFFRGQYTHTSNTLNDRSSAEQCGATGITMAADPLHNTQFAGASDCLLVGQVLRSTDGQTITVNQVLALHDPTHDTGVSTMNDDAILGLSQLRQGNQVQVYTMEWGSTLLRPNTSAPAAFSLMIARTPVSGTVKTYFSNSGTVPLMGGGGLLGQAAEAKFCVDTRGVFNMGIQPMGIDIQKNAANTTAVSLLASGSCV